MRNLLRAAIAAFLIGVYGYLSWPGVIVAGLGLYALSLKFFPYRPCRTCRGSKSRRDFLSGRAYGRCVSCNGDGEHPRLGVRLFRRGTYREIRAGKEGRNH